VRACALIFSRQLSSHPSQFDYLNVGALFVVLFLVAAVDKLHQDPPEGRRELVDVRRYPEAMYHGEQGQEAELLRIASCAAHSEYVAAR